ncbi:MAG: glyoxalase [Acidobacteria bacterium]|nr:glyoxalase [Acidobacteriota bacterium]
MLAPAEHHSALQWIDHIAIAVPAGELEAQVAAYRRLGFLEVHREDVLGGDQVREVLLRIGGGPNLIQLLEPLSPASPVQKVVERNGGRPGFAHIAYRVPDIEAAYQSLAKAGFRIVDAAPRPGSRGTRVFFLHPKSHAETPFGYLIEIVEAPAGE